MVKWQDHKNLNPVPHILAKKMENVKSQRGAKNAAQYGTTHQSPLELTKILVINASVPQA